LTGLISVALPHDELSAINRQQLFKNYRFLNFFLSDSSASSLNEIDPADRNNPLLAAIERLRQAQQLVDEKKYELSSDMLAKIPGQFPYIAAKRDELQLRSLYAIKKFKSFIYYHDTHRTTSLEIKILLLNSLMKNSQIKRAMEEFRLLFSNRNLSQFLEMVPRPALQAMLKGLDEDFWFSKFSFLLKTAAKIEFRRELPYCSYRSLARLFKAEFAYLAREYAQSQILLQGGLDEKYQPFAEKILLKIAVRLDPQADILGRLQAIKKNSRLYPELLFDVAQILVGKGEFEKALPLYSLYLQQSREQDEEYWKTVWLLAWIHYRQDRKDLALQYFQKGCRSPLLSYQIASRYWLSKLENRKEKQLHLYPFSYYTVRVLQDRSQFKNLNQTFINSIATAPSASFLEIIVDLKLLAKYGLWDDCLETIRAAKTDLRLNRSDLNLLKIIESLIYYRQNHFYQAFAKFRSNFQFIESVRLPNFLSGIFFPRQYSELIAAYSKEQLVDPYLVQALIREESFFRADSVSPAKAYGLMQLLHSTARKITRNGDRKIKVKDLYDPEINIRLGLDYLKTLLDKYDGRLYLALAAYNAGTERVDQWLADFPDASEDEFIEMIPFSETRNYVKNVLRNYFFYRYYYEKS
jgi:soluble lytic murein transglycosylase